MIFTFDHPIAIGYLVSMQCVAIYSVCHESVFGLQIMYCVECLHVLRFCLCFHKTKIFDFISPTRKILKGKYAMTNCQIILNASYPKNKSNGENYDCAVPYFLCNKEFYFRLLKISLSAFLSSYIDLHYALDFSLTIPISLSTHRFATAIN